MAGIRESYWQLILEVSDVQINLESKGSFRKDTGTRYFPEFYLTGGTSLLLKYNHRLSLNFDFFLLPNKKFKLELYEKNLLTSFQNLEIVYRDTHTLIFSLNGVKVSLFEYPYPLIKEIEKIKNVLVASDEDIAYMKVDAISKRGLKKRFFRSLDFNKDS